MNANKRQEKENRKMMERLIERVAQRCKKNKKRVADGLRTVIQFHGKYRAPENRLSPGFLEDFPKFADAAFYLKEGGEIDFPLVAEISVLFQEYLWSLSLSEGKAIFERFKAERGPNRQYRGVFDVIDSYCATKRIELFPGHAERCKYSEGDCSFGKAPVLDGLRAHLKRGCETLPLIVALR